MNEQEVRLNAMFQALQTQRDAALLQAGQLAGEVAVLQAKLKEQEEAAVKVVEPSQD